MADADLSVAKLYEMIHPSQSKTEAVRAVLITDPDKKVRFTMTHPISVGRNFDQTPQVTDALPAGDLNRIATPLTGDALVMP